MYMNGLELSVIQTLAYFDIEDYPLTKEELYHYLWKPPSCTYDEFVDFLSVFTSQKNFVQEKWGHFFLKGREEAVEKRREKIVPTELMLKKAMHGVKLIRSIPFLKAVFVCNSVGREVADKESDIDFLIITTPKRMWLVRFFTNVILRLFRLRTYGNHEAGRICLSFFLDTDHLNLAAYRACEEDIHFAYWIHQMFPLYDPEDMYTKFVQANTWTQKFLPNLHTNIPALKQDITCHSERSLAPIRQAQGKLREESLEWSGRGILRSRKLLQDDSGESHNSQLKVIEPPFPLRCTNAVENSKIGSTWKRIWEKMWQGNYGSLLEREAKKLQLTKLKPSLKEKSKLNDKGVVLEEGILKFHEHDARLRYREKWLENCKLINK